VTGVTGGPRASGPDAMPRILALMGSGETAPTMSRVHRQLAARLGPGASGVLLDTPYGFQENADEITARALDYFARTLTLPMTLAPLRRADEDPVLLATAGARLQEAGYVFAGPGSPSYALRQWRETAVPRILAEKLASGGVIVLASAAALTVGACSVPVYEVYKVGEDPRWLPGLDLLGPYGLPVAVIPHFDNAEGGTHDTRYCYLGEVRLRRLEAELPEGHFVLGVDSHTALVLDLAAGLASVTGLGAATVRVAGRSQVIAAGTEVGIDELSRIADALRAGRRGAAQGSEAVGPTARGDGHVRDEQADAEAGPMGAAGSAVPTPGTGRGGAAVHSPLLDEAHALEERFETAMASADTQAAVRSVLELEELLVSWSGDTTGTNEADQARGILRTLIVRLAGRAARAGAASLPAEAPRALVDLLVELRARARSDRDFDLGDRVRAALLEAGIELRDGPAGTTWHAREQG
jgi:hypothetical protein